MLWIETNKSSRPFAAGALAYINGRDCDYGCHFGMRSTVQWAREEFKQGWNSAQDDHRNNVN